MKSIQSNVWKIYAIQVLRWSMFLIPVIIPFYQENGLSMTEILLLQSVYGIIALSTDIPTGYFADLLGLKRSLVIGCILGFFGYLIYSLSYSFAGFLTGEIILGLSISFISGADSAMVYETLALQGRTGEYKKIEGTKIFFESFPEGLASIIGGFLALISLRFPVYFEAGANLLAIPLALTLVEPARKKMENSAGNIKTMLRILRFSLHEHLELKWLIIYSAVVGASTLTIVWFIQPYFQLVDLPLAYFGITWAVLQFSVAITAYFAHRIEAFLGRRIALICLILLSTLTYLSVSFVSSLWAIGLFFIIYFVRGVNVPVFKDYLNRLISSDIRATVLSVRSMILRLIFSLLAPMLGYITDLYSFQQALLVAGIIFLVPGLISLLFLAKHKAL